MFFNLIICGVIPVAIPAPSPPGVYLVTTDQAPCRATRLWSSRPQSATTGSARICSTLGCCILTTENGSESPGIPWGFTTTKSLSLDRTFCGKGQANLAMGGLPLVNSLTTVT